MPRSKLGLFAMNGENVFHAEEVPEINNGARKFYVFTGDYGYCNLKIGTGSMMYNQRAFDFHLDDYNLDQLYLFKGEDSNLAGDLCLVRDSQGLFACCIYTKGISNSDLKLKVLKYGALILNNFEIKIYGHMNKIEL